MKIAVFSDIHSNLEALEAIIKDIKTGDFDEIICLGDIIGLATNPKECLDILFNNNIKLLLGNHDLYYLYGTNIDSSMTEEEIKHHTWINKKLDNSYISQLKKCKTEYILNYNNKKISFKHFFINNKNNKYPFYTLGILYNNKIKEVLNRERADISIYGHEHKPTEFESNNKIGIGIGSSGCVKNNETFYTIIEIDDDIHIKKRIIKFDRKKFVNKIKNTIYPEREFIAKVFFGIDV